MHNGVLSIDSPSSGMELVVVAADFPLVRYCLRVVSVAIIVLIQVLVMMQVLMQVVVCYFTLLCHTDKCL